jgi:hypothetical protein
MPDHAGQEISRLKVAEISSRKGAERAAIKSASEGPGDARDQRLGWITEEIRIKSEGN